MLSVVKGSQGIWIDDAIFSWFCCRWHSRKIEVEVSSEPLGLLQSLCLSWLCYYDVTESIVTPLTLDWIPVHCRPANHVEIILLSTPLPAESDALLYGLQC